MCDHDCRGQDHARLRLCILWKDRTSLVIYFLLQNESVASLFAFARSESVAVTVTFCSLNLCNYPEKQ